MEKQKNDDLDFDHLIVEEKPKRKPKLKNESRVPVRNWLFILALVAIFLGVLIMALTSSSQRFENRVVFTSETTFSTTIVSTSVSTTSETIIDGVIVPVVTFAPQSAGISQTIPDLAWSPDGNWLAVIAKDQVRLYNAKALTEASTLITGYRGIPADVEFSPDSRTLAITSHDFGENYQYTNPLPFAGITLWDVVSRQTRATLEGHLQLINAMTFNPNGTQLASASEDQTVRLWNTLTGEMQYTLQSDLVRFEDIAYDPNGNVLVIGTNEILVESGYQNILQKWDLTRNSREALVTYNVAVYDATLSADGTLAALSTADGIQIWDTQANAPIKTLPDAATGGTVSMDFVSGDDRLAAAYQMTPTGIVQFWSVDSGQPQDFSPNTSGQIRYSPDGSKLAVGTFTGQVQIFDTQSGEVVAELAM